MIHIFYIIDKLQIGGTEKQLLALVNGLNRKEFSPSIVVLKRENNDFEGEFNCPIHTLQVNSFFSFAGIRAFLKLKKMIQEQNVSIVQTFFQDATFLGVIAAKLAKTKVILAARRDLGFWYSYKSRFLMTISNRFLNRILVNSNAIKEQVIEKENVPKDKIDVIPNGVHLPALADERQRVRGQVRKKLMIPDNHRVIGIVANFNRKVKRVDLFLKAAYQVLKKNKKCFFFIIGDGEEKQSLVDLSKNLKIESQVLFLGQQKNPSQYLCAMDIGVNSSDSEGFSNAVLEYMNYGVPVVATENPGNTELIRNKDFGILVPRNDPKKMAMAILELLGDKKTRNKIAINAANEVAENYRMENMITKTASYYKNFLDEVGVIR